MGRIISGTGGSNATASSALSVRLRYLFFVVTVFGGSFIIVSLSNYKKIFFLDTEIHLGIADPSWKWYNEKLATFDDSFTIKTKGCSIPALNPLDEDIKVFVKHPRNFTCPNSNITLLTTNKTHIWIIHENKQHYHINKQDNFSCCYKAFTRPATVQDISSSSIDDRVQYGECTYFEDVIKAEDEFVQIICMYNNSEIYQQFFIFAPYKNFVSHGANEISKDKAAYNVIIMGIDAVSRLNFHRTMPRTLSFLKNNGAVELYGYNKVGDNTFPNLIPMLMGIKDSDLKKTCLPTDQSTFDNCPFIWEWFKQAGYYTALGEDSSIIGSFNYCKVGFSKTPTDYYIHTFINEAENIVGRVKDFNSYLCMNDKFFFQVLLDYIEDLTVTLKSTKLFGFFWEVTMSHDYLNRPMIMDTSYEAFLKNLQTSKYLEDTIYILLSDHGMRWGDIRNTKQGRLEERLPFVYFLMPQSFRETYKKAFNNLKLNSRRLTTPFDIHETLNDLVDLTNIEDEKISVRSNEAYALNRGISLFLPIPENRTCKIANIDDHWCTCHKGNMLKVDDIKALEVAAHLVQFINILLMNHTECAQLSLSELIEVMEMEVGKPDKNETGWREFMVTVRTTPGDGVFEATMRHDGKNWLITGTVSRLNLYGSQSHCMHNYQLKLYCYCL